MNPKELLSFVTQLLQFDEIVIQCHDNPDADAIASGWALWNFFHDKGKSVRLVYGGLQEIQKSNLTMMIRLLGIQIEHVTQLPEPELLLMVDCQHGQHNIQSFSGRTVAVIDHHRAPADLPPLWLVQDGCGACATIVWQLLDQAGYSAAENQLLATALYYGLYMDTGMLQELRNAYDRNMRNQLEGVCDENILQTLNSHNLSLDELRIAGHALSSSYFNPEYRFAVAEAAPCDPNILGIVSDTLIGVDAVDSCVVYCVQAKEARLSVRSCVDEVDAPALTRYLTDGLGGGGGHRKKAGGGMELSRLVPFCEKRFGALNPAGLSALTHRLLEARMEDFFQEEKVYHYGTEDAPLLSGDPVYEKKSGQRVGYVLLKGLYPEGAEITVRELERDQHITVREDSVLVLLPNGTVQHDHAGYFWERHNPSGELYHFPGSFRPLLLEGDGTQKDEDPRQLVDLAQTAQNADRSYDVVHINARQLTQRAKVYLPWTDKPLRGERGDWLAANVASPKSVFIIKKDRFAISYAKLPDPQPAASQS